MPDLLSDLRTALRGLQRRPLQALAVVTTLALGLSAGIAVFTYLNAFRQPFPGVAADGLVRVFGVERETPFADLSYLDYLDYAQARGAFGGLAAAQPFYAASVRLETMTEVAFLEAVSGSYLDVLGVRTALGRGIEVDDDRPGAPPVAVISHAWWRRSFGADSSVIGSTVFLNFRPFTLVGVAPPDFLGTDSGFRPDVWIPLAPFADRYVSWARQAEDRDVPLIRVYARLRDGARPEQALSELRTVATGLDEAYPRRTEPRDLRLDPATWIDPRARVAEQTTIGLMVVAAGVLLLLVCANVANLLLTVAAGRRHEMAMRASLGASPGRLVRQVLAENVLLSAIAGLIALALASPLSARLGSYFSRPSVWGANVSRETALDLRVVAFALVLSLATGLIAGLLPALRASRRDLAATLKAGGRAAAGTPRRVLGRRLPGLRDVLVATQAALSVLLLVVAGLVLRTLASVASLDPGFAYEQLIVTHISTSSTTLRPEERDRFFREIARRAADEPWVRSATVIDFPLLSPHPTAEFRLDGRADPASLVYSKVIPGFFEALGIAMARGRSFAAGDTAGAPDVAVVNESLANRFFPGQDPVGRRLWWPEADGAADRGFEIVGVVRDTKTNDYVADVDPTVYFSYPQHAYPTGSALIVAVTGDPAPAVPRLQAWLRAYEPHLAIVNVIPYAEVVRGFLYTQRMNAEMFSALALLGLTLAGVGIFSVTSLAVARETRDIGVRMAVGAPRRAIARLVVGRALAPVALGVLAGLGASLALTGLVGSLLYGVAPTDPPTLAGGTAALLAVALAAAFLPARRAAAVDPMAALRHE